MDAAFRKSAHDEIARLLQHWRVVEFWIKRAEQINKKAIIPAMNELRYSSRQLLNAIIVFERAPGDEPDPVNENVIRKRIIVAEQYLLNAEHDICDAIVGFYDELIAQLDLELGRTLITLHYPGYPLLVERVHACRDLIAEARHDYEKRAENYKAMRDGHFQTLADGYRTLVDAEVNARFEREERDAELVRARAKIRTLEIFGLVSGVAGIISIPLSIYLWMYSRDQVCADHADIRVLQLICPAHPPQSPAN